MKLSKSRRWAIIFLLVCLLIGTVPISAGSPDPMGVLGERLYGALMSSATVLDLSDSIPSPAELREAYVSILENDPELFYVAPRLSYAVGGDGSCVTAVYPVYTLSGDALADARMFYKAATANIVHETEAVFSGHTYTDAEVVLLVHDLLAARYDYDTRAVTDAEKNRDAYTFFRDGVGVCQAYAMAAIAVLRALGYEADLVTSDAMDHAWVHVRVGESWYHMDITRDDPTRDGVSAGLVTHTRILRSDEGLRALGYHDFSCSGKHECSDERYEDPVVTDALSEMDDALLSVPLGKGGALVWVGEDREGEVCALSFDGEGITVHKPWDIDGDGVVTLGDLLLLSDNTLPEAWRAQLRRMFVDGVF